jgi:6-phosphogluconate dehydrogenase, C-terminal domain
VDAAPRTPGREGELAPGEAGYLHCGPSGAGHFVKMVHNGIEYGLMAAYAEGLNILGNANAGAAEVDKDAETAPLEHPEAYRYEIDVAAAAEVWRRGSVIASWLLDLTAEALVDSPQLEQFSGLSGRRRRHVVVTSWLPPPRYPSGGALTRRNASHTRRAARHRRDARDAPLGFRPERFTFEPIGYRTAQGPGGSHSSIGGRSKGREVSRVRKHAVEPLSARLSWEEVHRLEVLMRTRASSLARRAGSSSTCPACGDPIGDESMRLAGVLVHPGCLPKPVRR